MDSSKMDKYLMDDVREKKLWEECVFVFDTSALLDFYYYPDTTKQAIFNDVFEKIKGRLWIPSHVEYEYLKNRLGVITKPINENYKPLLENILKPITENTIQIEKKVKDLKQNTKNSDKHPHFEHDDIIEFEKVIEVYLAGLKLFDTNIKAKIAQRENEIIQLKKNDTVLKNLNNYFEIGEDYSFEQILAITKEGKHRYEFDIPPGYQDLKIEKKEGTQIFGDLIIWKQILDYAKAQQRNVVFVCNDVKKDWCIRDEKHAERIKMPREELIKEFSDFTGKQFWMYSQPQFLYTSNKLLRTSITEAQIEQISQVLQPVGAPLLEADLIWKNKARLNRGYSQNNPMEIHEGRPTIMIGNRPIVHWILVWNYNFVIYNNSSHPAFNIQIESIGNVHFSHIDKLPKTNNLPPLKNIDLKAEYEDYVEGDYSVAEEIVRPKIPLKFDELIIRIKYYDEQRMEHYTYVEFKNGNLVNRSV